MLYNREKKHTPGRITNRIQHTELYFHWLKRICFVTSGTVEEVCAALLQTGKTQNLNNNFPPTPHPT